MNSFDQKVLRAMLGECKSESMGSPFGFSNIESYTYGGHGQIVEVDGRSYKGYVLIGIINGKGLCASVWNKKVFVIYDGQEYFRIKDVPNEKIKTKLLEWLDAWL